MVYYLPILVTLPLLFAAMVPFLPQKEGGQCLHKFGIGASAVLFLFSLLPWLQNMPEPLSYVKPWFPDLGISFALGSDGLTLTLVILTTFLGLMAAVASYTNITKRLKLYYSMFFLLIAAVLGVFTCRDLFLFFLFWELELIPMYFLIAVWGGPRRDYAAMKFVLYTLFGSVFLVAGVLALYFHAQHVGSDPTTLFLFDTVSQAVKNGLPFGMQALMFIAFFITFAIKLPMVPFHTWLPDAHVEAPTPISMLLAGILLKMGSYGLLRFCFGFFPEAAQALAPAIVLLAVINIVYTASVALVQTDLKKLIAYSSVSHMGFVLLGLAALNSAGFNGAVFVMVSHGLVSAALFMCVGTLYLRTHTRLIADYGGFGSQVPVLFYFFMFMSMASLGLPLLMSFPGESMVFYGAFLSKIGSLGHWAIGNTGLVLQGTIQTFTVLAAIGIIIGAAYMLWLLQRVFFGDLQDRWKTLHDATRSEVFVLGVLAVLIIAYGIFPQALMTRFESTVTSMATPYLTGNGGYVLSSRFTGVQHHE